MTAQIRAEWSRAEERRRRGVFYNSVTPYSIKEVKVHHGRRNGKPIE